jgi:hypothetical protein
VLPVKVVVKRNVIEGSGESGIRSWKRYAEKLLVI